MVVYKKVNDSKVYGVSGRQRILLDLSSGKRKPQNKEEEILLKEIQEIKAKGGTISLELE
jgi:uncharacterized protein YifE (UPF0438 family)